MACPNRTVNGDEFSYTVPPGHPWSSRLKVVRVRVGFWNRLFTPRTPELAYITNLNLYGSLPEFLPSGTGRSQQKYKNTTVGGLGASAGARLDAPTRWL
eukprot:4679210-Pleurochrysis_carterae.AAC.1